MEQAHSFALQKKAAKIVLVRNYPAGAISPKPHDIDMTDRMQAIGDFVKIPLYDHLIINPKKYYSFVDSGQFKQIKADSRYDLTFKNTEKLIATIDRMERGTAETISRMILDGHPVEKIARYLRLPITAVKKIKKEVEKDITG